MLAHATPRTGPLGLPRPTTGAFAAVFRLTTSEGATYAAKCFLSGVGDQQARYRAIADHLAETVLPHTVGFDYQPAGIRVGGEAFPLLKMEWAEGTPLNRYVADHLDTPGALHALADAWADMLTALSQAGVAHGDLQHGNVLVAEGPVLRLVDYDTTFVPALEGKKSAEVGHRNYQHPDRTEDDFGPSLDHFPGLAVYTALRAVETRPGLWETYDTGENLLFRAADFYDPDASPLFATLAEIDALSGTADALRAACHRPLSDVPSLADARSGAAKNAPVPSRPVRHRGRQAPPREGWAKWGGPALAVGVAVAGVMGLLGAEIGALAVLLASGVASFVASMRDYRQQPVVRRRRRLAQEQARFAKQIETLRREAQGLREQRQAVHEEREEHRAKRLDEVREEALRDRLKHHFIGEVRAIEGLTHRTVVRLKAAGIRTAYEATPEAVERVSRLGPETTARLRQWRTALAQRYAGALPGALSPAQTRRLRRYAERRTEQIDEELARTRRKIDAQEAERADAETRAETLPALSPVRYLRYLLRLEATLPAPEDGPPAPTAPRPATPPERPPATPEPPPSPAGTSSPTAGPEDPPWYAASRNRPPPSSG